MRGPHYEILKFRSLGYRTAGRTWHMLASLAWLCSATSVKLGWPELGSPLTKSWIRYWIPSQIDNLFAKPLFGKGVRKTLIDCCENVTCFQICSLIFQLLLDIVKWNLNPLHLLQFFLFFPVSFRWCIHLFSYLYYWGDWVFYVDGEDVWGTTRNLSVYKRHSVHIRQNIWTLRFYRI